MLENHLFYNFVKVISSIFRKKKEKYAEEIQYSVLYAIISMADVFSTEQSCKCTIPWTI